MNPIPYDTLPFGFLRMTAQDGHTTHAVYVGPYIELIVSLPPVKKMDLVCIECSGIRTRGKFCEHCGTRLTNQPSYYPHYDRSGFRTALRQACSLTGWEHQPGQEVSGTNPAPGKTLDMVYVIVPRPAHAHDLRAKDSGTLEHYPLQPDHIGIEFVLKYMNMAIEDTNELRGRLLTLPGYRHARVLYGGVVADY